MSFDVSQHRYVENEVIALFSHGYILKGIDIPSFLVELMIPAEPSSISANVPSFTVTSLTEINFNIRRYVCLTFRSLSAMIDNDLQIRISGLPTTKSLKYFADLGCNFRLLFLVWRFYRHKGQPPALVFNQ